MPDSEYSEHESENSFDENEDNEIDDLDELFKGMGLEPYQFEHTRKIKENHRRGGVRLRRKHFLINHWENLWVGKIEW